MSKIKREAGAFRYQSKLTIWIVTCDRDRNLNVQAQPASGRRSPEPVQRHRVPREVITAARGHFGKQAAQE